MSKKTKNPFLVLLDGHDRTEGWAYTPQRSRNNRVRRRFRQLDRVRGNCFFSPGFPSCIIDFCYRSAVKLNLKDRKLYFMRGVLRKDRRVLTAAVSLRELDWGTGTAVIIPRRLRYRDTRTFIINNSEHEIRTMELVVLQGLLRLAFPRKNLSWYADRSADIISRGWKTLEDPSPPEVTLKAGPG